MLNAEIEQKVFTRYKLYFKDVSAEVQVSRITELVQLMGLQKSSI